MFLIDMFNKKTVMPAPGAALPGRAEPIPTSETHFVSGRPLKGPYPDGFKTVLLGMGCFWGAERLLWKIPGVHVTAAGYSGGLTPNPTYHETTTGLTGHTEVVRVVYDPAVVSLETLLKAFFEAHDPTQGMRQGNDIGTTYRSAIYLDDPADLAIARRARDVYQAALIAAGRTDKITTEIAEAGPFYFAEDVHQQYLAKNPGGYCGLRGTGVSCAIG
ncbi:MULTISPECIES: peptide-methionine (S)-S-oxide reductase MsrA [unclassified Shinella]|jgi:peptide-methionine (S)-S-oxide reductase|uniref:peptide-methionine (S)-S-oxide reductase MsrA n=1 Tax=unclassified Shinella TaxID=2643062 RepID=UPI0003C5550B|nr:MULTISPECIES: peptide-methionine (S)-S-oxide reductase MsrA [unclassified Shinella]MCA0344365.1 peptide-methionine (S)-S-oxide reductase MsrA [Pseudomonadota bacterium]EYR80318.1 peptide methionine sulfoxide reductase MsrA 1 [Shinella sp. DD12]MCO5152956.1 peptide-methionine (S)-S-oxide reductase MsrA [Shinella sp.]MDC7264124.1 peptide-methionine (S)-S-oxide reductase MsrA [Shinella sp. HY16]MDC7271020.1 peptide-methionine (S)-S-oxide reductase MsrA [Shinella sp. YZ44]